MERLIATLDPTIGDTCEKAASYASEALVDVQCDRDGGSIWYTLFPDEASMYDYYNASVSISGIAKDTSSCTGGEVSESVWNFRDEEDIPRGRILCQIADSGSAFLDFTVDETLTIGSMLDLDGDLERLFTIWAEGTVIPIIPS